jgi:hypothetical protein
MVTQVSGKKVLCFGLGVMGKCQCGETWHCSFVRVAKCGSYPPQKKPIGPW